MVDLKKPSKGSQSFGIVGVGFAFLAGAVLTLLVLGSVSCNCICNDNLLAKHSLTPAQVVPTVPAAAQARTIPVPALPTASSLRSSSSSCNAVTSKVFSDRLTIDFNAVRAMSKDRLSQLKHFTVERYEKYFMSKPGQEHYTLLEYLMKTFGPVEIKPCAGQDHRRHVGDIGTRYIASALALGAASQDIAVKTFDLPDSRERKEAFRGRSEQEWQQNVLAEGVRINFVNQNLVDVTDEEFKAYTAT